MAWVKAQNERSLAVLQGDPRYRALHAAGAGDRPVARPHPGAGLRPRRPVDNFWQDADHVRGVWRTHHAGQLPHRRRRSGRRSSTSTPWPRPRARTGSSRAPTACRRTRPRCLVSLSDGGKDAVTVREFDTIDARLRRRRLRPARGQAERRLARQGHPADRPRLGPGHLTKSGYPYHPQAAEARPDRSTRRGGVPRPADRRLGQPATCCATPTARSQATLINRGVNFYRERDLSAERRRHATKLPLPLKSTIKALVDGQLVVTTGAGLAAPGALQDRRPHRLRPDRWLADPATPAQLVLRPTDRESIEGSHHHPQQAGRRPATTMSRGAVYVYEPNPSGEWTRTAAGPAAERLGRRGLGQRARRPGVRQRHRLSDPVQPVAGRRRPAARPIWSSPCRPGSTPRGMWSSSSRRRRADGTKIPYFVVHKGDMKHGRANPTLLYAYGGFQLADARLFGHGRQAVAGARRGLCGGQHPRRRRVRPALAQGGLKQNRQRVYDDFFAVAQDLIARKITSQPPAGHHGRLATAAC